MSTILKALRRLEEEREAETRDLRDQVVAHPPNREARPRLPLLIGAGAVGAALVIGGFLYLQPGGDAPASTAVARTPHASPAPVAARVRPVPETRIAVPPAPREAPLPAPRETSPARVASAPAARANAPAPAPRPSSRATPPTPAPRPSRAVEPVAVAAVSAPPPVRAAAEPASPPVRAAAEPASPPVRAAASEPASDAVVASAAVAGTPSPTVEPTGAPPEASPAPPAPPEAASAAAPSLVGEPEVARRRPLPRMVVQRTLWHPYNERRVAYLTVEGHEGTVELREGDAVGDAVVKQIDPSAVLFVHRGVEIRRRVGATN